MLSLAFSVLANFYLSAKDLFSQTPNIGCHLVVPFDSTRECSAARQVETEEMWGGPEEELHALECHGGTAEVKNAERGR